MALQSKLINLLCTCIILTACQSTPSKITHAIVLVDITSDDPNALPSSDEIINNIRKLHSNVQDGIKISFALLDDLSGAPFMENEINHSNGTPLLENPNKRKREVDEFYLRLGEMINEKLSSAQIDKNYSKIYIKICKSLKYLQESASDQKLLILYSDLLENSETASFYNDDQLKHAISDPIGFYDSSLKNICELSNLNQIKIHINVMRDFKNDTRISQAERFWKDLFDKHNCKVNIDFFN